MPEEVRLVTTILFEWKTFRRLIVALVPRSGHCGGDRQPVPATRTFYRPTEEVKKTNAALIPAIKWKHQTELSSMVTLSFYHCEL